MRHYCLLAALAGCSILCGCMLPPAPRPQTAIRIVSEPLPLPEVTQELAQMYAPSVDTEVLEPLSLSLGESILMALERNRQLSVQRLTPQIIGTFEQEARAVFDPVLGASAAYGRDHSSSRAGGATRTNSTTDFTGSVGVDQYLPTGTDIALEAGVSGGTSRRTNDPLTESRIGLTVTQALLRGFGLGPNLVEVRQARIDTLSSEYELRGFTEALVAAVESAYWDVALAERGIEIVTDSVTLAEQQLQETRQRIEVGTLARTELAAAEAELARRKESLINANSFLQTSRLRLLRLLNPAGQTLTRDITLTDLPFVPTEAPISPVYEHVQLGMLLRPEMNQARLNIQRDELELVQTRNGLLPRMDLFVTLGKSGYADSFSGSTKNLDDGSYDALVGLQFELPLGNRAPEARHQRAVISRAQSQEALQNLAQLVELDVRSAYIEISRSREQVTATAATRALREEALRAETEKFRVGKSTSFLVAQAQRDLLASQVTEIEAVVSYLKAIIELSRLDGTLLKRLGISAPGQ